MSSPSRGLPLSEHAGVIARCATANTESVSVRGAAGKAMKRWYSAKKTQTATLFSNPVVFDVHPPAFVVEIDPYAPRQIKRGQVLQVKYTVKRRNGFINKIHSELAAPGFVTKVRGLRGRGVTFVGQTQSGNIQIIANKDAPLGQQPFLRIYAVGVLEDEAIYHGSHFLQMKIVP